QGQRLSNTRPERTFLRPTIPLLRGQNVLVSFPRLVAPTIPLIGEVFWYGTIPRHPPCSNASHLQYLGVVVIAHNSMALDLQRSAPLTCRPAFPPVHATRCDRGHGRAPASKGGDGVDILWWIIVGLVAGGIASLIVPGRTPGGMIG